MLKFWKKKSDGVAKETAQDVALMQIASEETMPPPVAKPKATWRDRFAKSVFNRDVRDLFARHPKLDDALLDELETLLITADVGVAASFLDIVESLRKRSRKSASSSMRTLCWLRCARRCSKFCSQSPYR